jgi:hypothetical protein
MDDEDWNDDEAGDMDGAEVGEASENRIESEGDLLNLNNAKRRPNDRAGRVKGLQGFVKYREKNIGRLKIAELQKSRVKKEHVQTL